MPKDIQLNIREGSIAEAVAFSNLIPEFDSPYDINEYHKRLDKVRHLILIAYDLDKAIGFKVGYEREDVFYTWMGGVLPTYRKYGIAKSLAEAQESWAIKQGFHTIELKTWNQAKAMLLFAIKSGFDITGVQTREDPAKNRILLRKQLNIESVKVKLPN